MKQNFDTQGLRAALEKALGFRLVVFKRLKCVNSVNFKAVREGDGLAFTVKCLPPERRFGYEMIVRHLEELQGTLAPERLFREECPPKFGKYDLLCLKWCEGEPLFPDRLSPQQLICFLDDYLAFSKRLQQTSAHLPIYPSATWRAAALAKCTTGFGRLVRPFVEDCAEEQSAFLPEKAGVQHGDLHPGNFAFSKGRVSGFFDIEGLTRGYPAWDIVRYFAFSLDHLRFYEHRRRAVILDRFALAVRHLPYTQEEWLVSLNVSWLEQINKKLCRPRVGLFSALRLCARGRLYREFRQCVRANAGR